MLIYILRYNLTKEIFSMKFFANDGKNIEIEINENIYQRHAIKTRFIEQGEDYISIIKEYVSPIYEDGDFITISEKIISLCQNRVVKKEDVKVGFWAKFLSKFASHNDAGIGVGEAIKMQYAINTVGLFKVLYACFVGGINKLFGKKGVFYEIVGLEVSGLDGFYGKVWDYYSDKGIQIPENPNGVCNEIKEKLGISCAIIDANDIGQEIFGTSDDLKEKKDIILLDKIIS